MPIGLQICFLNGIAHHSVNIVLPLSSGLLAGNGVSNGCGAMELTNRRASISKPDSLAIAQCKDVEMALGLTNSERWDVSGHSCSGGLVRLSKNQIRTYASGGELTDLPALDVRS